MGGWLSAFLLTQLVEVPIYARLLGGGRGSGSRIKSLGKAFAASAITHPIVWLIPEVWPWGYWGYVAFAEAFAVLVEGAYLHALGVRRALVWSLIANAASVSVGLTLRTIFGWP